MSACIKAALLLPVSTLAAAANAGHTAQKVHVQKLEDLENSLTSRA
jgi:hypothetical protein